LNRSNTSSGLQLITSKQSRSWSRYKWRWICSRSRTSKFNKL